MKKLLEFWENNTVLWIFGIMSIVAGVAMILRPDLVSNFVITLIGITWILEGLNHILKAKTKRLDKQLEELEEERKNLEDG